MSTTTITPANDFPALEGRPVTQGHADVCAARGHATHTVAGVAQPMCPRCGEAPTQDAARWEALMDLHATARSSRAALAFIPTGTPLWVVEQRYAGAKADAAKYAAALNALTTEELVALQAYRLTGAFDR